MLSAILDRLQAQCPSFAVIGAAPSGAAITTVDAAAASQALKALLEAAVGKVYPVDIPEGAQPTDAAYRLVSAKPFEVGDVRVLTVVGFVVHVRAVDYAQLMIAVSAIEQQADTSPDAVSITDAALDFDPERNHYLAALEVQYAVPALSTAASVGWPALLVDAEDITAAPSVYDNTVRQRVTRHYSVTVLTADDDLGALLDEAQAALLGWQQAASCHPFELVNGRGLAVPGGLFAWRDTYADSCYISQP